MYNNIYETWIVDECGDPVMKCENLTQKEIEEHLKTHPEHQKRILEV